MATAATFYTAFTAWMSLQGLSDYKLSGIMELHRLAGMRQYSASIIPHVNSTIKEPEEIEKMFRNGNPEGYILIDVATGQIYSEKAIPKPNWRIQLTYMTDTRKYDAGIANSDDIELERVPFLTDTRSGWEPRRYNEQPRVEVGPGAFKHKTVTYPPNFLQMHLKKLIKLKEKMEEELKEQEHDILNP